jgi:hypothetical protein
MAFRGTGSGHAIEEGGSGHANDPWQTAYSQCTLRLVDHVHRIQNKQSYPANLAVLTKLRGGGISLGLTRDNGSLWVRFHATDLPLVPRSARTVRSKGLIVASVVGHAVPRPAKRADGYCGAASDSTSPGANIGAVGCRWPDSGSAQALPVQRLRRSLARAPRRRTPGVIGAKHAEEFISRLDFGS